MTSDLAQAVSEGGRLTTVSVSGLRVGATLRCPIYDGSREKDLLLLAAGTTITSRLLSRLEKRGIQGVRIQQSELYHLTSVAAQGTGNVWDPEATQAIRQSEDTIERTGRSRWTISPESFVNMVRAHGGSAYDRKTTYQFAANYKQSVRQVETFFEGLSAGDVADMADMAAVTSQSLVRITEDLDLFVALGIRPATDKYPCKHSLQTTMLAVSVGTILGLKHDELLELGIGCLVHDAGMLHIKPELVACNRQLNPIEFLEITKHPTLTFDLMHSVKHVPNGSRMVAYQMHERCDGSGYPQQRRANRIHLLAKIAAVADVFVALISPRPHRSGMLPYHAMEQMIHGARNRLYDPSVVRALLHTVSLFPIGSYVEVSDGRVGQVVRSNRQSYTRPVVELWLPESTRSQTEIVDLSEKPQLKIARPIAGLRKPGPQPQAEPVEVLQPSEGHDEDYWE